MCNFGCSINSSYRPLKIANPRTTVFRISNVHTGAHASLLSDTDGVEIVNMTLNLKDNQNNGSGVGESITIRDSELGDI